MFRTLFATLVLLLLAAARCPADEPAPSSGTWLAANAELGGTPLPEELLKTWKLEINDGKYVVTTGEAVDKGTVKVDAKANPKTMDITGTDGPNKGKTFLAIYEQSGDTLKVCYDLSGKSRPTEFKTKPNTQLFLAVYKREKK
jgi:uncharacterized protein (TIGR03067 family)